MKEGFLVNQFGLLPLPLIVAWTNKPLEGVPSAENFRIFSPVELGKHVSEAKNFYKRLLSLDTTYSAHMSIVVQSTEGIIG